MTASEEHLSNWPKNLAQMVQSVAATGGVYKGQGIISIYLKSVDTLHSVSRGVFLVFTGT